MTAQPVGIHDISLATTHYALDLAELAHHAGVDPDKYYVGLGQEIMSIPAADEDIVTMAAEAAAPILDRHGTDRIRTVLVATETGVDQAKSAGLYLHPLLGLPDAARVVELKQACYAGTAALQFATALVSRDPSERVLVIATDIARYDRDSPGEATQGAAAVAMLVTADPAILEIEPVSGMYSADVMDFWRPNYRTTALADGKYSISCYLRAVEHAYTDYHARGGRGLEEFAAFCYHQPFTRMAYKAHQHLLLRNGFDLDSVGIEAGLGYTTGYNRLLGNSYTASLYVGLACLLDTAADLDDEHVMLASYGSGAVAEIFGARVVPGYRDLLRTTATADILARRKPLTHDRYLALHHGPADIVSGTYQHLDETSSPFHWSGASDHKRIYRTAEHSAAQPLAHSAGAAAPAPTSPGR